MRCLDNVNPLQRTGMAILGIYGPGSNALSDETLDGLGHRHGCLTSANYIDMPEAIQSIDSKMIANRAIGIGGGQSGAEDPESVCSERL